MDNRMYIEFDSKSENESFARVVAAAFVTRLNPTIDEVEDIKTAVSEAVTNSIIHGYQNGEGTIKMECMIHDMEIKITITDDGIGIDDIDKAREPLFTTRGDEERSGMGFSFMEIFMDTLEVTSQPGQGTSVVMTKIIGKA